MKSQLATDLPGAIAALEHLTGPSRGTVTWLNGTDLDLVLESDRFITVSKTGSGQPSGTPIARLHHDGGSYELEAVGGRPVWVNRKRLSRQRLTHRDMIEFGESGPLSRFCLYRPDHSVRRNVGEVLSDASAYLRVSRSPLLVRMTAVVGMTARRLIRESTLLFRFGVIVSIGFLAALTYQQYRMNALLQQRIESDADRLEDIARVLSRARDEALAPADLEALRREIGQQVLSNVERLRELERQSGASARVIAVSTTSVVFLQGAYGFRETSSGRLLRHVVGEGGRPLMSPLGQPLLTLDGDGPVAERQFTGTAFAIADGTVLVTNRHVALPWENDASIGRIGQQGLEPVMSRFLVYLPGSPEPGGVELLKVSENADLALLRRIGDVAVLHGLKLADVSPPSGAEVIVMGYPTGLRSMLAQAGEAFIKDLQSSDTAGFWEIAERLAESGRIVPLASRGIVSQVSPATIVYDAETTHGGSGGPVLDTEGRVVAVNTAILPQFGGSNLGVPVVKVRALLEGTELTD